MRIRILKEGLNWKVSEIEQFLVDTVKKYEQKRWYQICLFKVQPVQTDKSVVLLVHRYVQTDLFNI